MKVNETKTILSTSLREPAAEATRDVPATSAPDRVSTNDASRLQSSVRSSMRMAAGERASRLEALTQEVRSGNYAPDASRLAEEILARADLDARLAQALG